MDDSTEAAATRTPRGEPVRIVLVDDHAIVREGLRAILEREQDLAVVGEASCHLDAVAVVAAERPSVVLVDLKLSARVDADGLALCRELAHEHPDVALLVLTAFLDADLVMESRYAGACGYLLKDADPGELLAAIRTVARGRTAFGPRATAVVSRVLAAAPASNRLTARETEILASLARGCPDRTIASELGISEGTVAFHVRNTLRKLGVTTRAEAVYIAVKAVLI